MRKEADEISKNNCLHSHYKAGREEGEDRTGGMKNVQNKELVYKVAWDHDEWKGFLEEAKTQEMIWGANDDMELGVITIIVEMTTNHVAPELSCSGSVWPSGK